MEHVICDEIGVMVRRLCSVRGLQSEAGPVVLPTGTVLPTHRFCCDHVPVAQYDLFVPPESRHNYIL